MNPISVGLIIPTFNRAHLVGHTITSALAQSVAFDEIIVVDDGSTDNTKDAVTSFGSKVRLVQQSNQGVQAARNFGVLSCSCDWIVLCDSDDILLPSFLEKFKSWISSHLDIEAVYCNFKLFGDGDEGKDKLASCPFEYLNAAILENGFAYNIPELLNRNLRFQPFFLSGCMIRSSFYTRLEGFDCKFTGVGAEDWDFTLRAIVYGSIAYCMMPLVKVRRHSGNDSANRLHMSLGEITILTTSSFLKGNISTADRREIDRQVAIRSKQAFDSAFAECRFQLVEELYPSIECDSKGLRISIKYLIARSPSFIRYIASKVLQRRIHLER